MIDPKTPILVGSGLFTDKAPVGEALAPHQFLEKVSRTALANAGPAQALIDALDAVAVVEYTADAPGVKMPTRGAYTNPPRTLAKALGRDSLPTEIYSATGGNSPQMLVNEMADRIQKGDARVAILTGCETIESLFDRLKAGQPIDEWADDPGGKPEIVGTNKDGHSDHEDAHGINLPVNIYPLFENGLRGMLGHSIDEHMAYLGRFFSPFTKVAADNPHSWFPIERSPEELSTVTDKNRWVGFPYPKFLNSIIRVNQGAALVMTSVEAARELGIDESRWVYLHGGADAYDKWFVSERVNYHSSPAIRAMAKQAFEAANWTVDDLDLIDLYSCFPSAVRIGCEEIGIDPFDPRGLTITGGLPYFGGAGSAYVMCSIAVMTERLRARPGAKGLVTANGYYVTKHACGLYSTTPKEGGFVRSKQSAIQPGIDAEESPELAIVAEGVGEVETYTVTHGRGGIEKGIIVGRLADGRRFLANTPVEPAILEDLLKTDSLGRAGTVSHEDGKNIFIPK